MNPLENGREKRKQFPKALPLETSFRPCSGKKYLPLRIRQETCLRYARHRCSVSSTNGRHGCFLEKNTCRWLSMIKLLTPFSGQSHVFRNGIRAASMKQIASRTYIPLYIHLFLSFCLSPSLLDHFLRNRKNASVFSIDYIIGCGFKRSATKMRSLRSKFY